MSWPYHLLDLTETEKHQRRLLLDRYAVYAQLSALIPIAAYQLYRLGAWVYAENQKAKVKYSAIPSSPAVRRGRASKTGTVVRKWRALVWWLEGEIAPTWGLRVHWVAGVSWMAWLLFLCIHQTGHGMFIFLVSYQRSCTGFRFAWYHLFPQKLYLKLLDLHYPTCIFCSRDWASLPRFCLRLSCIYVIKFFAFSSLLNLSKGTTVTNTM